MTQARFAGGEGRPIGLGSGLGSDPAQVHELVVAQLLPREAAPELVSGEGAQWGVTFILLSAVLLAVVGDRLLKWSARLGSRLGLDAEQTLGSRIRGLQWFGSLLLFVLVIRWLLAPLPAWVAPLALVGALLMLLATTGLLGDVLGGLVVQFRLQLREGDYVQVGSQHGEVEEIQFLRIRIGTREHGRIYLPNRQVLRMPVQVAPLRNSHPLSYSLPVPRPLLDEEHRILRERLMFLPYRVPGSPLSVASSADGTLLEVTCHLWARNAAVQAESAMRRICQEAIQQLGPTAKAAAD